MSKINQHLQDKMATRFEELQSEIMAERGLHKHDHTDQIIDLAWEALLGEFGLDDDYDLDLAGDS